jgi:DNA helicase II / ATP-dependent DNA helicase PcrA
MTTLPPRDEILEAVSGMREILDQSIAEAIKKELTRLKKRPTIEFDWALAQLLNLSQGKICYYDLPTSGVHYLAWYQAKRINPLPSLLERVYRKAHDSTADCLRVVDLGAGTGATSWGLAFLLTALKELGHNPMPVEVDEIDGSPFMLRSADTAWSALPKRMTKIIERRTHTCPWPQFDTASKGFTWLFASYLLDHGDGERIQEAAHGLKRVAAATDARGLTTLTSNGKKSNQTGVLTNMSIVAEHSARDYEGVWAGTLNENTNARRKVKHEAAKVGGLIRKPVIAADKKSNQPIAEEVSFRKSESNWKLPGLWLSQQQKIAAEIREYEKPRPTLILGAAGSGKSVVLAERTLALAQLDRLSVDPQAKLHYEREQEERVLVTTFNKQALEHLIGLTIEQLEVSKVAFTISRDHGGAATLTVNVGSSSTRIEYLNFDKLPTRLFDLRAYPRIYGVPGDHKWKSVAADVHPELTHKDICFLFDEYRRVLYGLSCQDLDEYLKVSRKGRGYALTKKNRTITWKNIEQVNARIVHDMKNRRYETGFEYVAGELFIEHRRQALTAKPKETFHSILVDEIQDFLPSDFRLLHLLAESPKTHFTYVGDAAQALHIGSSFERPPALKGQSTRWQVQDGPTKNLHILSGSYRIPMSIACAIRPIASAIDVKHDRAHGRHSEGRESSVSLPESRKAAVLGVRPILIVGTEEQLPKLVAEAVSEFADHLRVDSEEITASILEPDVDLKKALACEGLEAKSEGISAIKGLERPLVIWSTRRPLPNDTDSHEAAYTIMSRASCLLILAIFKDATESHLDVLKLLAKDHVRCWNEESESWARNHLGW